MHRRMANDGPAASGLKRDLGAAVTSAWRSNPRVPIKTRHRRHISSFTPPNKDGNERCLINPQGLEAAALITFTATVNNLMRQKSVLYCHVCYHERVS